MRLRADTPPLLLGKGSGLPPAPSERWQDGRHGAMTVMAQALEKWPRALEAAWPRGGAWLELSLPSLLERALEVADREWRVGGRAYIGSTSDPAWRWDGGWYRMSLRRSTAVHLLWLRLCWRALLGQSLAKVLDHVLRLPLREPCGEHGG